MQRQNQADVDWARRTASRFGNPEVVRAELDEQAKLVEREKTRPTRTHDLEAATQLPKVQGAGIQS